VLVLALLVPAVVWAAREKAPALGLGGLFIGLGAGSAGLLTVANARCVVSNVSGPNSVSGCVPPHLTAFFVAAALLAATGVGLSILGIARAGSRVA
jgi:hypothetical protein